MWPHEFEMLWHLSQEPMTAGELAGVLNCTRPPHAHRSARTVGTQLRGHVKRGFLVRDESFIYRLTEEGRRYVDA